MKIRGGIALVIALFLNSCADLQMGMEYQSLLLLKKEKIGVYCYCVSWGIDSEAYFISTNNNVCLGFESTKDYCFGKGHQVIYYKYEEDTLKIYSYGSIPNTPKWSDVNVSLKMIDSNNLDEYEAKVKNKEMRKVDFDSLKKVPCSVINQPINLNNLKFE